MKPHFRFHVREPNIASLEVRAEKAEAALRLACREIVRRETPGEVLAADVNYVVGKFMADAALAVPRDTPLSEGWRLSPAVGGETR